MKRYRRILTFVVISICLLQSGCQEQAKATGELKSPPAMPQKAQAAPETQTALQANKLAPKITFENTVHDFGNISPDTKDNCEFKFTNTGDGTLKISKIQATCGCTVPKLTKHEYKPGESGHVKVNYHSGHRTAPVTRFLYVLSNDKTNPKAKLSIKANVIKQVEHEPKILKLSLTDENAACPQITLTSLDGKPFAIRDAKSSADCVVIDYDPTVTNTKFVIQPKIDVGKLQNKLRGQIDIALTHPECKKVTIPFQALARFKTNPASLIVFNAKPQEPIKKELWVLSNYDENFEIESTSSKNDTIKVLKQEKIGNRYKFELQITAPAAEGKRRIFTDVFSVNINGDRKLNVTCRGFYPRDKQ